MAQFEKRLGVDFSNAFSGDGELFPQFFQGVCTPIPDPKSHSDDLLLLGGQDPEYGLGLIFQVGTYAKPGRRIDTVVF
jgi:hypothetical protein